MTEQEAYDKVLFALRKQRQQSADSNGACLYRGPGGLKCAVGHLLPDHLYSHSLEMTNAEQLPRPVLAAIGLHLVDTGLLEHLQKAHDRDLPAAAGGDMTGWERAMQSIASRHQLKYTPTTQQSRSFT